MKTFPYLGKEFACEDPKEKTLYLAPNEHITKIYGYAESWVRAITFETDHDHKVDVGREKGEYFELDIPEDHEVGLFRGSFDKYLSNI